MANGLFMCIVYTSAAAPRGGGAHRNNNLQTSKSTSNINDKQYEAITHTQRTQRKQLPAGSAAGVRRRQHLCRQRPGREQAPGGDNGLNAYLYLYIYLSISLSLSIYVYIYIYIL